MSPTPRPGSRPCSHRLCLKAQRHNLRSHGAFAGTVRLQPGMAFPHPKLFTQLPERWPQSRQLKTTEVCYLTVWRAGSLESRGLRARFPPGASGEGPYCLFQLLGLQTLLGWWLLRSSLCLLPHPASPSRLCPNFSLLQPRSLARGPTLSQQALILTRYVCKVPVSRRHIHRFWVDLNLGAGNNKPRLSVNSEVLLKITTGHWPQQLKK